MRPSRSTPSRHMLGRDPGGHLRERLVRGDAGARRRSRPDLPGAISRRGSKVPIRNVARNPALKSLGAGHGRVSGPGGARGQGAQGRDMRSPFAPAVVTYHGSAGAFAQIACRTAFPRARAIACGSLLQVIEAVRAGRAEAAVLPCENLLAGRVPDIHLLLPEIGLAPEAGLRIVGEIFLPIELHLVAPAGRSLDQIRRVHSHPVALNQVRRFLAAHGLAAVEQSNTATAAALIRQSGEGADAAVASELAARTYGLTILKRNIEDNPVNMTRFYVLARDPVVPAPHEPDVLTSLLFELDNAPGALFGALGGFADAGINMTKLESYLVDGQFVATRFLCEFEGHPERDDVRQAIDTLVRHSTRHAILGVFPMHATGTRTRANVNRGGLQ